MLTYRIGIGLGERLLTASDATTSSGLPNPVANLQANCLAGVLIGAVPEVQAPREPERLLAPALWAYGSTRASLIGSRSQRGYDFLTGLGATAATCSINDMADLSRNRVPDGPQALEEISRIQRPERGSTSIFGVLRSQFGDVEVHCDKRGKHACPRRLPPINRNTPQPPTPQGRTP